MASFQKTKEKQAAKPNAKRKPSPLKSVSVSPGGTTPQLLPNLSNKSSAPFSMPQHQKSRLDLQNDMSYLQQEEAKNTLRIKMALADARSVIVLEDAQSIGTSTPSPKQKGGVNDGKSGRKRCLALISHNHMKPAMQEFVMENKEVLRHFRLTGTNSTMTMLRQIFEGMDVEYGPTMSSGPLGGDAQVAALLTFGDLGGMIFFADPLSAHPHIADVNSLIRLANVHDVLYALNLTSARSMIRTLREGLKDPAIIPSFYNTLESPSVAAYRAEQTALVAELKERQLQLEFTKLKTQTLINRLASSSAGGEEFNTQHFMENEGLTIADLDSLKKDYNESVLKLENESSGG